MKKAAREKRAREILGWEANKGGITAEELSDVAPMELSDAEKALHSLWLQGDYLRKTRVREYLYWKKAGSESGIP